MNPQEQAKKLLWKYLPAIEGWTGNDKTLLALNLALICVEEIIISKPTNPVNLFKEYEGMEDRIEHSLDYWKKVKTELELKLENSK